MESGNYCYDYPRPAVSADMVVFGFNSADLMLLLIKRGNEPFKDKWALPGGFLEMNETIESCAERELLEETSLEKVKLEQLYTFSSINRDPRGRVLTVAFWTLLDQGFNSAVAGDDAALLAWYPLNNLPELAFDHALILEKAKSTLKNLSVSELILRFSLQPSLNQNMLREALVSLA
jgi:8-oxo-dGTP diphosphatase